MWRNCDALIRLAGAFEGFRFRQIFPSTRRFVRRTLRATLLMFPALFLAAPAIAQFAQRGGVEGFVFDSSGAVIVGAKITLVDLAEKQSRQAVTDDTGHFVFADLAAGQYQLSASATSFNTAQSEPITVNIGRTSRYDYKLTAGSLAQSVTVSSGAVTMDTGPADLSTDVSPQQVEELPVNGRNFTEFAALMPGIATTPQLNINPGGTYSVGAQFASGGIVFTSGGLIEGSRDNGYYHQRNKYQRQLRKQHQLGFLDRSDWRSKHSGG